eukprot:scaffold33489_cov69-Phaeocystis_antarctica.AAC.3
MPLSTRVEAVPAAMPTEWVAAYVQDACGVGGGLRGKQGPFDRPASPRQTSWPRLAEAGRGWPALGAAPGVLWRWWSLLGAVLAEPLWVDRQTDRQTEKRTA